jgi:GTP-binding protein EngB required for normal cell division
MSGFAKGDKKEIRDWGRMMEMYMKFSPHLRDTICLIDAEHGFK